MPRIADDQTHAMPTRRSGHQYVFTKKHHGHDADAACWVAELTLDEEFAIFDFADNGDFSDEDGNLYGLSRNAAGRVRYLGEWKEQIAEFPVQQPGAAWHGTAISAFRSSIRGKESPRQPEASAPGRF